MSINFNHPVDSDTAQIIRDAFAVKADDQQTFILDELPKISQRKMREIANKAMQPVEVEMNSEGDIKTMRDGTRYQVTPQGWVKI